MARLSATERLLQRAVSDPSFRVLPAYVRLLWLELVAYGAASPERGRIRFLGSVIASVSRLLSLAETEVETGLENLCELRLLELDPDGRSIWLAGAREGSARAEAARINGLKGGRPRKVKPPVPGQTEMLHVLPGSLAKTQETEAETQTGETAPLTTSSESKTLTSPVSPSPARETDWVSLGQECADVAKMDPVRGGFDFRPVQGWLTMGATPELIREVISERAKTLRPGQVFTLKFFDKSIREAVEAGRVARKPIPVDGVSDLSPYGQALQAWIKGGMRGPAPRREDFLARSAA